MTTTTVSFVKFVYTATILVCLLWTFPIALDTSSLAVDYVYSTNNAALDVPSSKIRINKSSTISTVPERGTKTLSLLFPAGLVGGYRNQAMRFLGFLRQALDENFDNILLPTLVWGTRYGKTEKESERLSINPAVRFFPIPFDELFDVDHWNSFHQSNNQNSNNSSNPAFSLPKLVTSVSFDNHQTNDVPTNETVCWKTRTDDSIVSVEAVQRTNPTFTESFLPLLTQRMLFGNAPSSNNSTQTSTSILPLRKPFILDPVQAQTMEYLTGSEVARKTHRFNIFPFVEQCTQPYVFGGKSMVLFSQYTQMKVLLETLAITKGEKKLRESYTKLIETVEKALVPAKPWRILADQCVEHHLGLGSNEFRDEEEDPHVVGHDHGYIVLHSRIEIDMLSHKCGNDMERNLTKILDLVGLLSLDYNSPEGIPEFAKTMATELNYTSPIPHSLRKEMHSDPNHRPLKGAMVAVARDDFTESYLETIEPYLPNLVNLTRYNRGVLNHRSISYDQDGNQAYSQKLDPSQGIQEPDFKNPESSLPIFECGEGWLKHAFYDNESHQKDLFTPSEKFSKSQTEYGLYYKYGPQFVQGSDQLPSFPLLPLPENYFGDLLPSMMNFWLAVRAEVFVGVKKSSWSTHVWTTRYYMGKGAKNFEYTQDQGILQIGNGGLPESHKQC